MPAYFYLAYILHIVHSRLSLQSKLYDEYFLFSFFPVIYDDLLLFNPDRHQFFKIIPAVICINATNSAFYVVGSCRARVSLLRKLLHGESPCAVG